MKVRIWWIGLAVLLVSALSGQVAPKDRIVIVISIDGFPAYAWRDQRLLAPNLTRLAREGARAEGMTPPNPTVTWPSHTTMITGVSPAKHGLLYNGRPADTPSMKPRRIEPWVPKEELVQFPTLYDRLFEAGFTTAEVDWVAIFQAKTITWAFPEIPVVNGPIEREMAEAGLLSSEDAANFFQSSPVWRDEQWTKAAIHILKRHQPNLLLFHLLNVDSVSHSAGPRTYASATAYAQADAHVGKLLAALRDSGLEDRATIFVVSDHGFKQARKIVRLNALLREKGMVRGSGDARECDAWFLSAGGSATLYTTNPERREERLAEIKTLLLATEGVARVFEPAAFAALGLPAPGGRMGDLYITAADGYAFNTADEGAVVVPSWEGGYPGHHGYLNTDPDLQSTFLAWGAGIRKGVKLPVVRALDVAPTIARLFGITLEGVDGQVIAGVLE